MFLSNARFAGALGPEGFLSCFDRLMPPALLRQTLILKGGPGVGKSTFMRRLHAHLTGRGEDVTLYFCSGDPDSLDAIAAPSSGILALDGTPPHAVEPTIPGARDSLIHLGVCLNEAALRPRLPHIRACMADHSACTQRAQAHLRAAWALRQNSAATLARCTDEAHRLRMQRALIAAVLQAEGEKTEMPAARPVITDAVTPKGALCLLTDGDRKRVIRLLPHFAMDLTPVLRALSQAAQAAGYDVEEHLDPTSPGCLLHLSIPALHTLVTTNDALACEQTFDFAACIPAARLLRYECALEQSRTEITRLTQAAVAALAQAKQLHDELETFYVPNMDFERWQTILDETLQSLEH